MTQFVREYLFNLQANIHVNEKLFVTIFSDYLTSLLSEVE